MSVTDRAASRRASRSAATAHVDAERERGVLGEAARVAQPRAARRAARAARCRGTSMSGAQPARASPRCAGRRGACRLSRRAITRTRAAACRSRARRPSSRCTRGLVSSAAVDVGAEQVRRPGRCARRSSRSWRGTRARPQAPSHAQLAACAREARLRAEVQREPGDDQEVHAGARRADDHARSVADEAGARLVASSASAAERCRPRASSSARAPSTARRRRPCCTRP